MHYKSIYKIFYLLPLLFFSYISNAHADSDVYVGAKLGYTNYLPISLTDNLSISKSSSLRTKKADTASFGGAIGMTYQAFSLLGLRTELEYMYRTKANSRIGGLNTNLNIQTQTALLNAYIDIFFLRRLSVYASGGLGLGIIDSSFHNLPKGLGKQSFTFAAQIGGGLQYRLFGHLIMDVNVRYLYFDNWRVRFGDEQIQGNIGAVEALITLGYKF